MPRQKHAGGYKRSHFVIHLPLMKRLFAMKLPAAIDNSVTRLQELLQAEFESKWEALRKTRRGASQPSLLSGAAANELELGM